MLRVHISRRGFRLIELLAAVGIVAVVIGMLLPAIHKVREEANRSSSGNNLKQIGLACVNYADQNNSLLPPANCRRGTSEASNVFSIYTAIIPFIESGPMFASSTADPTTGLGLVKTFCGPNDPTIDPTVRWQAPSYICNAGPDTDESQALFNVETNPPHKGAHRYPASISDGTSNTIAWCEAAARPGNTGTLRDWTAPTVNGTAACNFTYATVPTFDAHFPYSGVKGPLAYGWTGIQVAMADGSVRNVTKTQATRAPGGAGTIPQPTAWAASSTIANNDRVGSCW